MRPGILLAVGAALLAASCLSDSGGCPRPGLDLSRRCKRLCVVGPGKTGSPLPCTCVDACLCWQMPGHVRRPDPPENG